MNGLRVNTGISLARKGRIFLLFLTSAVFITALLLAACVPDVNGVPQPHPADDAQIEAGRALIASYGCGSCHSVPGVPGADSLASPPLNKFYARSYIAGRLPNTEENLVKWIMDPQEIDPGNAMPDLGVSEDEARSMAAFLYRPPRIIDMIRR